MAKVRTKTMAVALALQHLAGQPMTREEALDMRGARPIDGGPRRSQRGRRATSAAAIALLPFDAVTDVGAAVTIYRRCRRAGVTPRGIVDCMIASVAWRHGAALLAHDVDLDRAAGVVGIDLDGASLRAPA